METITIERSITNIQSTTLSLPYYAKSYGGVDFYAITGEKDNIHVAILELGTHTASIDIFHHADNLPADAEQIGEDCFYAAYERAQLIITDKFMQSCPSAKAPEVWISEKEARKILSHNSSQPA